MNHKLLSEPGFSESPYIQLLPSCPTFCKKTNGVLGVACILKVLPVAYIMFHQHFPSCPICAPWVITNKQLREGHAPNPSL